MTLMDYKGYVASTEIDVEDNLIFGEVIGLRDTITFQGRTVEEAVRAFHESVDLYLLTCQEQGLEPDRPRSVSMTIRIDHQVHLALLDLAAKQGQSLDQLVDRVLTEGRSCVLLAAADRAADEAARRGRKGKAGWRKGKAG